MREPAAELGAAVGDLAALQPGRLTSAATASAAESNSRGRSPSRIAEASAWIAHPLQRKTAARSLSSLWTTQGRGIRCGPRASPEAAIQAAEAREGRKLADDQARVHQSACQGAVPGALRQLHRRRMGGRG